MLAIVLLSYKVPLAVVEEHTAAHRAYMKQLHEEGHLVASGPFVPRTGGALLIRAEDRAGVERLLAVDPFNTNGVADYDIRMWAPTLGASLFG